ncbi:uncharacterized protein (DUF885 family) [Paucibacter oligotrophus]|uniref:Uncharacterized protein (DUF885 family) n=1 Tax=Roseateles oligotrophus TaxID=1769250 RepID=A0A840LHD0_9BURK|nr:DUF885 domain-containing protein [Roseateles oligotrophus]MBB4846022.1 uncharacterized protein (DUF885 family) [Roseateles oligotrophus]
MNQRPSLLPNFRLNLAAAAVAACLALPAAATLPPPSPQEQAQAQVQQLFDAEVEAFLKAYWQLLPEAAAAAGQYEAAARLPAPSEAARQAQIRFCESWLKRLALLPKKAALNASQAGDLALLDNHLQGTLWALKQLRSDVWDPTGYNVSGGFSDLLNKGEYTPQQRLQWLEQRLRQVPAYYRAALQNIKNPSPPLLQMAISQNQGGLEFLTEGIPALLKTAKADAATAKRVLQQRDLALRSMQGFIQALQKIDARQTADGSGRSFRIGREAFHEKFRYEIQAEVDAPTLYQRALDQKAALHQRMSELADGLWPQLFPGEAAPAARLDKIARVIDKLSERHVSAAGYIDEIRAQLPALADWVTKHDLLTLDPSRPLQVRETPAYMRGLAGASISAPGPLDPQGVTYYNVDPLDPIGKPEKTESYLREYNHWVLQILSIHEAIPGHYVQLLYSNKSPSKVKALFGNGAMVEGWAVYSERMMMESGWGSDKDGKPSPEMGLMYAKWNLRVVCNAILDYSVHVLGMSEQQALHLLEKEAFQSHTEATEKWHRAQVSSVQLSSYFAGFSEILALRDQLKAGQGRAFNLKAFHEEFLSHGSAPVAMVSQLMKSAAASKRGLPKTPKPEQSR